MRASGLRLAPRGRVGALCGHGTQPDAVWLDRRAGRVVRCRVVRIREWLNFVGIAVSRCDDEHRDRFPCSLDVAARFVDDRCDVPARPHAVNRC